MHIVAIVQARMTSSRLPGKVLQDIGGQPMLARVVERARRAKLVNDVWVATTSDPADDAVAAFCQQRAFPVFRGNLYDVLDRFYQAALSCSADVIVRLTADCPVVDPALIDTTIEAFLQSGADFAANRLPPPWHRTYPIGLDVEVCGFAALERAWKEASLSYEREHVMPYFYDQEGRFKVTVIDYPVDYGAYRWTVDTPADLDLLRAIYARFGNLDTFTWQEVAALVQREPELLSINAGVYHKHVAEVDERGLSGAAESLKE